jgi:hypothetical protein
MTFAEIRAMRKEIAGLYEAGTGKNEIFDMMKERVAPNEVKWLSRLVGGLVKISVGDKYRLKIIGMLAILGLIFALWLTYPYPAPSIVRYPLYLFIVFVIYRNIYSYRNFALLQLNGLIIIGAMWTGLAFIRGVLLFNIPFVLFSVVSAGVTFYAFYLRKDFAQLHRRVVDIKKDSEGNYIFSERDLK